MDFERFIQASSRLEGRLEALRLGNLGAIASTADDAVKQQQQLPEAFDEDELKAAFKKPSLHVDGYRDPLLHPEDDEDDDVDVERGLLKSGGSDELDPTRALLLEEKRLRARVRAFLKGGDGLTRVENDDKPRALIDQIHVSEKKKKKIVLQTVCVLIRCELVVFDTSAFCLEETIPFITPDLYTS